MPPKSQLQMRVKLSMDDQLKEGYRLSGQLCQESKTTAFLCHTLMFTVKTRQTKCLQPYLHGCCVIYNALNSRF